MSTKQIKEFNLPVPPAVLDEANTRPLELTAYEIGDATGWTLEPASPRREWMGEQNNFAYRCLPLTIANQAGWVIGCPVSFVATWSGSPAKGAIRFDCDEPVTRYMRAITEHFGNGIITFNLPWLFRTSRPRVGLRVSGPPNVFKFNCGACEGFVEADWLPFTFTMNWKILRPGIPVQFVRGEPICFLQPATLDLVEATAPRRAKLSDEPELEAAYRTWDRARAAFNADPRRGAGEWQRFYHGGGAGQTPPAHHRTALEVRAFT